MRILITNDDGIESDGIVRLARAAKGFGEVFVVAPDNQRSAMSHSITLRECIDVYKVEDFPVDGVKAYKTSGTPADCVRFGRLNIMKGDVDLVLSGINCGYNIGSDTQYSATVGAALEAASTGVHAIALSEDFGPEHETTDEYLEKIIDELKDKKLDINQIWNVNFPGCSLLECRGVLRDRRVALNSFFKDHYEEEEIEGGLRMKVVGERITNAEEGTDFRALLDNYVSIGVINNLR